MKTTIKSLEYNGERYASIGDLILWFVGIKHEALAEKDQATADACDMTIKALHELSGQALENVKVSKKRK